MDKIILTGMRFYGYHGVLPEEARLGQGFTVDLELLGDLRAAGVDDDLKQTINYGHVYTAVKAILEGERFKLIEAVAERVAERLLAQFPAYEVMVRVHKPKAPIPGPVDGVAVEIRRQRGR
jgi:dihydroneopterin aldolase